MKATKRKISVVDKSTKVNVVEDVYAEIDNLKVLFQLDVIENHYSINVK